MYDFTVISYKDNKIYKYQTVGDVIGHLCLYPNDTDIAFEGIPLNVFSFDWTIESFQQNLLLQVLHLMAR